MVLEDRTPCEWHADDDGAYWTSCDQAWVFNDGGPSENGMKFCPYCGHPLVVPNAKVQAAAPQAQVACNDGLGVTGQRRKKMDDKELLERAATAAKMDCRLRYCDPWKGMALYTPQDGYFGPTWNPLTDDGDALRLAHKLGLLSDVPVWPRTLEETRRAIVREAAALVPPNVKVTGPAAVSSPQGPREP